jgi:uncharacterized protein YigE (DUF2233 family)
MFDQAGQPVGLYVEEGEVRRSLNTGDGSGNFYMKPNGVFFEARDGTLRIVTAGAYAAERRSPRWATQSGPMLVIGGALHPKIAPDGPSKNVRNGVGIINSRLALFAISETPVSFGQLARFFRDGLNCRNALYLDGVISSAWVPSLGRRDNQYPLGPMVVVLDRK